MIKEKLKTIENVTELVYQELKNTSHYPGIDNHTHGLLLDAYTDMINVKRKIELVRAYMISNKVEKD